jgi:hypothetical protein
MSLFLTRVNYQDWYNISPLVVMKTTLKEITVEAVSLLRKPD